MKKLFLQHEWIFLILALAFLWTIVPMMISAASWLLVLLGIAYGLGYLGWLGYYLKRFLQNIDKL